MFNIKKCSIAALLITGSAFLASAQVKTKPYSWSNLPKAALPAFKKDTFNIIKYGAKPDGITLNTESINKTIDACSAKGGGVVLIPQGLWLTGPIKLKSNVNLHVSRAALVQFTADKSQYKLIEGNWEGHAAYRNESPISGTNLTNIAITGEGIIDGNGEIWRLIAKDRLTEQEWNRKVASGGVVSENGKTWYPSAAYYKAARTPKAGYIEPGSTPEAAMEFKDYYRPNMLVLANCKKVLLQGATFQNSAAWCLHTLMCEDLTFDGVRVRNPWNAANGDGVDVESCKNVLINNSTFDCGDDGICIKSGRDEEGRKRGKPTENMVVKNSIVYRAHGGFVIGSEMSGGARNLFVTDCTFIGTDIGLRFKTTRGRGGVVENIHIKNIAMRDIVTSAILFDMYYTGKSPTDEEMANDTNVPPVTEATPVFKDFWVSNVSCNGADRALMIRGLPEMAIKNINLENVSIKANKGIDIIEGKDITLKNFYVEAKASAPLINVINSNNVKFSNLRYGAGTEQVFGINGKKTSNIEVTASDLSKAKQKVAFKNGADQKAFIAK
ncbi:glycoside hydrolase family 28 protein [Mucilaginibacter aquatilis]|uniref:Glycoside hydrolase family 28 protein n=1 Tax=Mucilaginibacter aquatilis TaxID=1517760 RepID=A0A6I4I7P5_9SPHI|nr:glycoside hydrolase family 28 protein [Mucilaginibacter aquatilis]MVN90088.1 glycoside hydrolase family 28 protein [Mucilaginibacter aquatilis]